jgi:dCMP deaminase
VHAEANAIAYAARYGVTLDGTEMFTTHQPCLACAQIIINAGIMRVVYMNPYRLLNGLHLLIDAGLDVEKIQQ